MVVVGYHGCIFPAQGIRNCYSARGAARQVFVNPRGAENRAFAFQVFFCFCVGERNGNYFSAFRRAVAHRKAMVSAFRCLQLGSQSRIDEQAEAPQGIRQHHAAAAVLAHFSSGQGFAGFQIAHNTAHTHWGAGTGEKSSRCGHRKCE